MISRGSSISQTVYETISSFDVRAEKYDFNCRRIESWTRIKAALFKGASLKRNDRIENIVSFEREKQKITIQKPNRSETNTEETGKQRVRRLFHPLYLYFFRRDKREKQRVTK